MLFNSNKLSNVVVYNSITNTIVDEKLDSVQPFSFLEFLNYTQLLDSNKIVDFSDYQVYLKRWNEVTLIKFNDIEVVVRQQFISFLKTIALNYTTSEERRYLQNIDFQNKNDLEVAAPFFATKIKQVLLYFAQKRDSYKIDLNITKNKGSVDGVTQYLRTTIIETLFSTNDLSDAAITNSSLSAISENLNIEVEAGYDIYNNYFDLDPYVAPDFYYATGDRAKYFTANTNIIEKEIFLDYNQAIINLINSEEVVLQELQSLVVNINTPNLNLLQNYDFIDYDNRTRANLRLILDAELVKKFTGTDFYYLSTNSNGQVLSGILFEAQSPFANLLNVNNPTTLTVPQSSIFYERDVGLFFRPNNFSILTLQTPFNYNLKEQIKNDYVYIFPDPNDYGNIVGISKTDHETPFIFVQQGDEIQKNISSNNALGNSFVTKNDFTFESYHSKEQNQEKSVYIDMYNVGIVSNYTADIFGNAYIGFKQQNTGYIKDFTNNVTNNVAPFGLSGTTELIYASSIKTILSAGTFANTESQEASITNTLPVNSIYTSRNTPGLFYVHNILTNNINPLSSEYSDVITKYPTQTLDIQNNLLSYDVYGTTFVMNTSSYVIIDKIDYSEGKFKQSPDIPLILTNGVNDKASNTFLVNNEMYIAKVALTYSPLFSGYNGRQFTLSLYSYNINSNDTTTYAFSQSANLISYNVSTLVNVTNLNLIFNKKQNMFNLVITLKDLNNNIFLHSMFLRISGGLVSLVRQKIYSPLNANITINFYDSSYVFALATNPLSSTPIINTTNGNITF